MVKQQKPLGDWSNLSGSGVTIIGIDWARGADRLADEAEAIAQIKANAAPISVGPEIVSVAPARGPYKTFDPMEMLPGSTERMRRTGFKGRQAMQMGDAFDVMTEQARRRGAAVPFTHGQISAGRDYQALVERLEGAGVRCSSLESQSRGSAGAGTFSEAMMQDSQRLARLRRSIGTGVAITVRRIRPSNRGEGSRAAIPNLALVDMVCIAEKTLSDVLTAFGWSLSPNSRIAVRAALCSALERMHGYQR